MNSESIGTTVGTDNGSVEGPYDNTPLWNVTKLGNLRKLPNHKFSCFILL